MIWMTTSTFSDLLIRFYKGNTTSSDTAGVNIVTTHGDRAEASVMSALSGRYSMPFTTVPPEARRIAQDIASYFIVRASSYQDGKEKQKYLDEFKTAFDDLKIIADGMQNLTYTDGSLAPEKTTTRMLSNTENYTPIFGSDDPATWELDPDQVEDQASAREG